MNDGPSDADTLPETLPAEAERAQPRGTPPRGLGTGHSGLAGLLDHLPGMAYRRRNDRDRTMEVVTAGCHELTGYTVGELLRGEPVSWADLVHHEDRQRIDAEVETALAARQPFHVVYRILTREGLEKWVAERGDAVRGDGGVVVAVEGFVEDVSERVLIEQELRWQEATLADSQRLAGIGSWERDPLSGLSRWSDEMFRLLGLVPGQAPASRELWLSCVHPEDRERVQTLLLGVATSSEYSFAYDCRVVRRDGAVRVFANRGRVVRDASGTPVSMVGTAQDITERRQAEEHLRLLADAGAEFGQSLDADALVGVIAKIGIPQLADACRVDVLDGDRVTRRVDVGALQGARRVLAEDAIGNNDPFAPSGVLSRVRRAGAPLLVPEVTDELLASMEQDDRRGTDAARAVGFRSLLAVPMIAAGETIGALTFYIVDGARRFGEEHVAVATALAERAAMAIQNARLYATVRDREERLRGFFDTPGVFLCVLELDEAGDDIVFHRPNEQLAASYGLTPEQMDGMRGRQLGGTAKVAATLLAAMRRSRATGQPTTFELMTTKTLTPSWRHARINPIQSGDGRILFTYIGTDATEYKRMEAQFLQAQKMEAVGRLAGGIAHDFNNLLTVIGGSADFQLMGIRDGQPGREDAIEIKRAAERAAGLTRQLLAFSRRQVVHPRDVDVNALVREAERMLRRLIGEDVDLRTALCAAPPIVRIDPGQLEQALVNLVVNARDAMPTGGLLTISTTRTRLETEREGMPSSLPAGEYVVLAVSDTGIGMDEATRERIFEPFFTTKELGKGTGLGLSTVFGIVTQASGRVDVESEPDVGSTFRLFLPIVQPTVSEAGAKPVEPTSLGGTETILLVEDEPRVRRFARRALEERGYTVLEAGSGVEALELAAGYTGRIHLVLTDVVLPLMSSRELLDALERLRPGMRVLFTSGYTADALRRQGVAESGAPFIEKPFTIETLTREVRGALDR